MQGDKTLCYVCDINLLDVCDVEHKDLLILGVWYTLIGFMKD